MKLLIDIGNTRVKWACSRNGVLSEGGKSVHRGRSPADAVSWVATLPERPAIAYATNVAGTEVAAALRNALRTLWDAEVVCVTAQAQWQGLHNAYAEPGMLGADRWASLVAAWHTSSGRICVVDAGTALTVDLVEADGRHLGGVIVPGLALLRSALMQQTSDLAVLAGDMVDTDNTAVAACGKDTASAMVCGTRNMLAALIDRMATDFGDSDPVAELRPGFPAVVLTGGDATILAPLLQCDPEIRPQLVLEGLELLAEAAS